ncbi:hypothetical protein GCM10007887_32540 [Methylobacterium haplocladii]|uniref:Uncharacterized protein n=1 Tax=Methylobacterium haplocladii TaxID=1176176 RepID=A0A512INT4_9HYPH|nr:hypothetical protein MHA02_17590 [Methylobacterium haplocladii]GJD83425.1 hypothetical protein HPGCJGGD_1292 [Methylobacterium haplocladii]GLS60573.1 hypothetical protein GCM10007887_32540 [Methylobacterium haplocladii]
MRSQSDRPACPFLDALIVLLDEEADTRDCRRRPELIGAMNDLEMEAVLAGASALTVSMIHASKTMLQVNDLMAPTLQ